MENPAPRTRILLICFLLAAATVGIYYPVVTFDFVGYDDGLLVLDNAMVTSGLTAEGTRWAFGLGDKSGTYWHPLTWLSHMMDCEIFGLDPGGHHATNLFLHSANVLVLFLVLYSMTGAPWRSGLTAALFALHPVNVESVAWVASRKNLLSTLFLLLSVAAYVTYCRRPNIRRYLAVFAAFVVGLLTKPMLVTVPFVLFLLDFWPLGRMPGRLSAQSNTTPLRRLVWEKIPLLAVSIGSVLISIRTLPADPVRPPADFQLRAANAVVSCAKYLANLVVPHDLSVFYPFPTSIRWIEVIGATTLLGAITLFALSGLRKRSYLVIGWLWFLVTFGPVSGLIQAGVWPEMADRWAYVPFIGLFMILAWGAAEAVDRIRVRPATAAVIALLVLGTLGLTTAGQLRHWRSADALFAHAVELDPTNVVALTGLADARLKDGKAREAATLYSHALEIQPGFTMAHNGLGVALIRLGRPADAEDHFRMSMTSDRSGVAALNLAGLLSDAGRIDEAISLYAAVSAERPDSAAAQLGMGSALARAARFDEALSHFREAVRLDPTSDEAEEKLDLCRRKAQERK